MLTKKIIRKSESYYPAVENLMKTAFPVEEQFPIWLLLLLAKRKSIDFLSYFDGELFCGISYAVVKKESVFLLYLAVNNQITSKGYGSRILDELKNQYPNKKIFLNIEPVDEKAVNAEQRVKRFQFYQKNGFYDTQFIMQAREESYTILSSHRPFAKEDYLAVLKTFSFGLHVPKVSPVDKVTGEE